MAEESKTFVVKPTRIMLLMSDKGSDNIRKIYFAFNDLHFPSIELVDNKVVTVDHTVKDMEAVLQAEEENGLVSHIVLGEVPVLPNEEVKHLFHTLWTKAVTGSQKYDKKEWMRLGGILSGRGYEL